MKTKVKYILKAILIIVCAILLFTLTVSCGSAKSFTYSKRVEVTYNKDTIYQKDIKK